MTINVRKLQNIISIVDLIFGAIFFIVGLNLNIPISGLIFIICCGLTGSIYTLIIRHTGNHVGNKHERY